MTEMRAATPQLFKQSIDGCLEPAIGVHGLPPERFAYWLAQTSPHIEALKADYAAKTSLPLLNIPEDTKDLAEAESAYRKLTEGADVVVFYGTGGSGLGGQTLAQLGNWNIAGTAGTAERARPRMRFYDNLDGATLAAVLQNYKLDKTRFVVTSKSGGTAETLTQAIVTLSAVKDAGLADRIPELFLGITEPAKPGKSNGLRELFASLSIPTIEHHTGIGGRFSCLTNVGLIPAIARGLDPYAIRAGAKSVIDAMHRARTPEEFSPAVGAALAVAMSKERGISSLVMMPYCDRLARMSAWFVQLWAESLGKAGEGTSPIACLGPLDQHSQLQLFMDGPHNHLMTVIRVASQGVGPKIDADLAKRAGASYLAGHTVGDVVDAQGHALPQALARAGRPVRTIDIEKLEEKSHGALLMHFMIETILAGRLLGLDPFDQPAVELAKVLTRERLAEGR